MKRLVKRLTVLILAAVIALPVMTANVSAASAVSITGGDQVTGGEIFTVTVTYSGDSIGRVIGDITYDTEMLSYISGGSSSGNVGYVELKQAGTGEALTFNLKFQAIKEGSTTLNVSTSEMYDLDEMYMDTPSASKQVNITGDAADDDIIEETTEPDDTASDEGLSVDEKDSDTTEETEQITTETEPVQDVPDEETADPEDTGMLAKYFMYGIGALVLILLVVLVIRRKK